MRPSRAKRKFPQLRNNEIKYCPVFYEGIHDDARTNLAVAQTAAVEGAHIVNYCEAIALIHETQDDTQSNNSINDEEAELTTTTTTSKGKVIGAKVRDVVTGRTFDVYAKSILLCGGPFTDELRHMEDANCKDAVNGASGIHIVLPAYYAPESIGLVDMNTSDGRFMFFLPWKGHVIVGTTDHKCKPTMRPIPEESVS